MKGLPLQTQTEDSLAQLVEHNTFNVGVSGSSPERVTRGLYSSFKIYKLP